MNTTKKTFIKFHQFSYKNSVLRFGYYGIKSSEFKGLRKNQVLHLEYFLKKQLRLIVPSKKVRIWNNIVTNLTVTKLSSESRMGKGKGKVYDYFTYIKPGQVLFEIEKINKQSWNSFFWKIYKQIGFKIKKIQKTNF